jgi:hypothetical protein
VPIFSANGAGCINKIQSIVDNIKHTGAGILTLQETHFTRKGKLNNKITDFEFFEAIRKKAKGGTLIGVHKSLEPILIEEYSEDFELVVVEVKLGNKDIRVMSGYGPQENWSIEERIPFFRALEEEIVKAKLNGKLVYIQMDANSKLGPDIIEGDPHEQSGNGKILAEIVNRHNLTVVNSVKEKCTGKITRRRITNKVKEESIIDFVITCDEMADMIEELVIDEEKKFVLTKYTKTKKGVKTKESDHNSLITKVLANWNKTKNNVRIEIYNLKDKDGQRKFKEMTDKDNLLSSSLKNKEKGINSRTKNFLKRIGYCISQCFRKVRICQTKRNKELEVLFNTRRILRTKTDDKSKKYLETVEDKLAMLCATDNLRTIKEACAGLSSDEGGINAGKLWQLKKRLRGLIHEPPIAMLDSYGNIVTSNKAIEELTLETYKKRLKSLQIKENLKMHQVQQENLCKERIKESQMNKTRKWNMLELEDVLKQLKMNKSRDPLGFANELFRPEVAGQDLKVAILDLMNEIKESQIFPDKLGMCNISSLYKNKGSKKDFNSYRGIFRVTILRSILDKLIYQDEYDNIDMNLTDTNVGARRKRNIRDNIFVINAVMNHVIKKRLENIDVQLYDVEKCFDKLWPEECINDIYDAGFRNDKLPLLLKENLNAQVAIKTRGGLTRRVNISNVIMQGTVWGSLLCTATMDKIGKMAYNNIDMLYKYHGVPIPPLGMVDDILTVTDVNKTLLMNSKVNTFMESKKLKLSHKKCVRIHIGNGHKMCPKLKVHENDMKTENKEKYLGDVIDHSGTLNKTIEDRICRGNGIVSEVLSILKEIPLGKHKAQVGVILREAMFVNGILFNSEAWHGVRKQHIKSLEKVDEALLRGILGAHSKTPKEFLYLELGVLPIRWVLAQRRMNYLKNILDRPDNELILKVYHAQKLNSVKGDFVNLIENDFKNIGCDLDETLVINTPRVQFKKFIKLNVRNAAFTELTTMLSTHTKVKSIKYEELKIQNYLMTGYLNFKEVKTMSALRSQCVRDIRNNFKKLYKCTKCPLKCGEEDTQSHILNCIKLPDNVSQANINQIYGNNCEMKIIASTFIKHMKVREEILERMEQRNNSSPGASPDQST